MAQSSTLLAKNLSEEEQSPSSLHPEVALKGLKSATNAMAGPGRSGNKHPEHTEGGMQSQGAAVCAALFARPSVRKLHTEELSSKTQMLQPCKSSEWSWLQARAQSLMPLEVNVLVSVQSLPSHPEVTPKGTKLEENDAVWPGRSGIKHSRLGVVVVVVHWNGGMQFQAPAVWLASFAPPSERKKHCFVLSTKFQKLQPLGWS